MEPIFIIEMLHKLLEQFWAESFNFFSPCQNARVCAAELQWSFDCKIFMLKTRKVFF